MEKIPVGETIAHAYGFAFRDFLKLLGITWAPLLVSIAVALMITPGFFGNFVPLTDEQDIMRQTLRLLPLTLGVTLIVRAMLAAGVTELALGTRTGQTFVYFSVGADVWRFLGAWLMVILVMVLLVIGAGIAFAILVVVGGIALGAVSLGAAAGVAGVIGIVLCLLAAYAALIYITVRLTFFIPPVVVAEKTIDLARGWHLTHGNFWRIFVIGLAIFLPLIVVGLAFFVAIYGTAFFSGLADAVTMAGHKATPDAIQQHMNALNGQMRMQTLHVWPFTVAYGLIVETFTYGLTYGASAFAYRAVTGGQGGMRSQTITLG